MKAQKGEMARAVARPADSYRMFLLYGPDDAGSRALAATMASAMGQDAERIDLAPAALKADPALLADEAASISLFGGARHIRVEGAGDEILAAVEALVEAPSAGNPVAVIAGALRKESKLLKLALASPLILVHASYPPEGGEAAQLVIAAGRDEGLTIRNDVARRIAQSALGDRAIIASEVEKLALYVDAAPDRPREIDQAMLDALGLEGEEGNLDILVNAVLSGQPEATQGELARITADGIPILRAVLRRLFLLADYRADVERGDSVSTVMAAKGRALFWKEKETVSAQLGRWKSHSLATAIDRLSAANRAAMFSGMGRVGVEAELIAIARAAQRMR